VAKVVIIGAGLTGLCVALELEKKGFYDYKIFEKNSSPGGLLRSFQQDGFTFDYTGHLLHAKSDYFKTFLKDIIGISNLTLQQRKSSIYTNKTLIDFPFQTNLYSLPAKVVEKCVKGFINKKTILAPKTFYEWVLHHFGTEMGKHFFFPYNQKLLAYDIKKLHHSWTGRFVPKVTLSSVLKGAIGPTHYQNIGYNSFFYYPKHGGIEFIIQQICKKLSHPIVTNCNIISIEQKNKKVVLQNGKEEKFEYLINTSSLDIFLSHLQETSSSSYSSAAQNLLCTSVMNFNIGFNTTNVPSKHWIYFPEKYFLFYRIGFWHNINKNSAPQKNSAIYGEISYLKNSTKKFAIKEKTEKAIQQSLEYLQLKQSNIKTKKILPIEHAYVIYDAWREQNIFKLLNKLEKEKILSIGRFGAWKYSSMEESVIDANIAVKKILIDLKIISTKKRKLYHDQQM
jgi:protoporphyrinogen oxidase